MSFFIDALLLGPTSIIYYNIIQIVSDFFVKDMLYNQKRSSKFLVLFISGLISMILSFKIFPNINILKMTPLKYGVMCAGLGLSLSSSISYWFEMDHKTKLFVLSVCLLSIVFVAIQANKDNTINYNKEDNIKLDLDDIDYDEDEED
jgi:hypothetical protein